MAEEAPAAAPAPASPKKAAAMTLVALLFGGLVGAGLLPEAVAVPLAQALEPLAVLFGLR